MRKIFALTHVRQTLYVYSVTLAIYSVLDYLNVILLAIFTFIMHKMQSRASTFTATIRTIDRRESMITNGSRNTNGIRPMSRSMLQLPFRCNRGSNECILYNGFVEKLVTITIGTYFRHRHDFIYSCMCDNISDSCYYDV